MVHNVRWPCGLELLGPGELEEDDEEKEGEEERGNEVKAAGEDEQRKEQYEGKVTN